MNNPLVSVIVPVYNGERFIREAIESILRQNYLPLEIIVVDDGSIDGTKEVIEAFGASVTYIPQDNQGPPAARNHGLRRARGEFIAFLDADDIWPDGRLTKMLQQFIEGRNIDVLVGLTQWVDTADRGIIKSGAFMTPISPAIAPMLGSAIFKKSIFDKVGVFNSEYRYADDQDWFIRSKEQRAVISIFNEVTVLARRHTSNITKDRGWGDVDIMKILKRSIDRRRQGGIKSLPKLSDFTEK